MPYAKNGDVRIHYQIQGHGPHVGARGWQCLRIFVLGGQHPYELRQPESSRLDGSDPEACVAALCARLNVNPATVPAIREESLASDSRALPAAQHYAGDAEERRVFESAWARSRYRIPERRARTAVGVWPCVADQS